MATTTSTEQRSFLFVNSTGPTPIQSRDKTTRTKIYRHVMVDIGKARRKPPRNPQFDAVIHFPDRPRKVDGSKQPQLRDSADSDAASSAIPGQSAYAYCETFLSLVPPFWEQHPLLTLEGCWGEDMFSAYGMLLLLRAGSNLANPDHLTENFVFPFAFEQSRFLHQFRKVFTDPNILYDVSHALSAKFRIMALERSSVTVACIERYLAKSNPCEATTNLVIRALLALICYNFINSDFSQALLHLRGLELVINARGGIHRLQGYNEIKLMIFWIDITASILYVTKPRFPPPVELTPPVRHSHVLPVPLFNLMRAEPTTSTHNLLIASCLANLNAVASLINTEAATKGDAFWTEVVYIELRTNPIIHRLLDAPVQEATTPQDVLFEGLRAGAVIWVISIKRRCGSFIGSMDPYVAPLLRLLSVQSMNTDPTSDPARIAIRSWLLVLCGLGACDPVQHRMSVDLISAEMSKMNWDWAQLLASAHQLPWIREFSTRCGYLKEYI